MENCLFFPVVFWGVVSLVAFAAFVIAITADYKGFEFTPVFKKFTKDTWDVSKYFLIPAFVITLITPNKEDLKFIVGGGIALLAVQNEEVQKLPENVVKSVNDFLESIDVKEMIEEQVENVTEGVK